MGKNKNKSTNYLKLYIMITALVVLFTIYGCISKERIDSSDVLTVVFLPALFVTLLWAVEKVALVFNKTKVSESEGKDFYLAKIANSLKGFGSLSVEDFRRLRINDKFQETLDIGYNIFLYGEDDINNYDKILHRYNKTKNDYERKAVEILVSRTKELVKEKEEKGQVIGGKNLFNLNIYGQTLNVSFKVEEKTRDNKFLEKEKLNKAIEKTIEDFKNIVYNKLYTNNNLVKELMDVYTLMANDKYILLDTYRKINEGKDALESYIEKRNQVVNEFNNLENEYMRNRANDIYDVTNQVIKNMIGYKPKIKNVKDKVVILNDLYISDVLYLHKHKVKGIVVKNLEEYSHTSFLLKKLNIPTFKAENIDNIKDGKKITFGQKVIIRGDE